MTVHLLASNLKSLKLPTFLKHYQQQAIEHAKAGKDHIEYLACLSEMETSSRYQKLISRRITQARFPSLKTLDSFDFTVLPDLKKRRIEDLARGDYITKHENIIAIGNSGTGKTHIGISLGFAACQQGYSVGFTTASSLVGYDRSLMY